MSGILQSFGDWLYSLGMIPRGCIEVVMGIDSLLFYLKWYSMAWLPTGDCLTITCLRTSQVFPFLAVMNKLL